MSDKPNTAAQNAFVEYMRVLNISLTGFMVMAGLLFNLWTLLVVGLVFFALDMWKIYKTPNTVAETPKEQIDEIQ